MAEPQTERRYAALAPAAASHAERVCGEWPSSFPIPDEMQKNVFQIVLAGRIAQVGNRIAGQYASAVNDSDPVAQLFGFAHNVRRKNDRLAFISKLTDGVLDLQRIEYIQANGGLIEDDDSGIVCDGSRYRNLL